VGQTTGKSNEFQGKIKKTIEKQRKHNENTRKTRESDEIRGNTRMIQGK
jgi:hypothetical protein